MLKSSVIVQKVGWYNVSYGNSLIVQQGMIVNYVFEVSDKCIKGVSAMKYKKLTS